jgi:hypothetical protein
VPRQWTIRAAIPVDDVPLRPLTSLTPIRSAPPARPAAVAAGTFDARPLSRESVLGRDHASVALAGAAAVATVGLAAANGGFFASSWGWATLGLFWLATVAVLVHAHERPGATAIVYG